MISKTAENIVRGDCCYTLFQTLTTNNHPKTVSEFLEEVIRSNHHFWKGDKFKDGMTWMWSDEKGPDTEHKNIKTFGFYNNDDIRPSDYKAITFDLMVNKLTSSIQEETDDKDYELRIRTLIQGYRGQPFAVYQFQPDKLEKSKFSVYSHFIAFILVDNTLKKAIRIEFGTGLILRHKSPIKEPTFALHNPRQTRLNEKH